MPNDMKSTALPSSVGRWTRVALIALFVGGLIAFLTTGAHDWLTVAALQAHRDQLLAYADQHYWASLGAALLIYAGAVALSVPGASIMSLALGMLFGRWLGTLLIIVAATLGATLVFLAARHLFADAVRRRLGERAAKLIGGFQKDAFNYLLFLRLVPLFPFWLVNLVPAVAGVSLGRYVAATFLGIIPASFIFANLGQSLGRITSSSELLSAEMLGALALLGVLALLPVAVKKIRGKRKPAAVARGTPHD